MNIFIGHKPNRQHIQALHNCKLGNEKLVELMKTVLEDTKQGLMVAEDSTRLYRLQGQAKAIQEFLDAIEKSSEVLERL